jgi:hypothetical protein
MTLDPARHPLLKRSRPCEPVDPIEDAKIKQVEERNPMLSQRPKGARLVPPVKIGRMPSELLRVS